MSSKQQPQADDNAGDAAEGSADRSDSYGGTERRSSTDRRSSKPLQADRRSGIDRRTGMDRRRGPGIRRSDERRRAEEGEMTDEQFEFLMAVEEYKRANRKPFPSWTEVLEIIKLLGYRKVAERGESIDDLRA